MRTGTTAFDLGDTYLWARSRSNLSKATILLEGPIGNNYLFFYLLLALSGGRELHGIVEASSAHWLPNSQSLFPNEPGDPAPTQIFHGRFTRADGAANR